eukprot:gb/GECG01001982.1/.p1 GENE.gb/GECG01001982.1/~~gb/GECG01001982.1/.p1  ORF type:complete len:813 (+),score=208.87 gb/GECG01001982.1/:1-2439(+)
MAASWSSALDIVGKAYKKANQSWQAIEKDIDTAIQVPEEEEDRTYHNGSQQHSETTQTSSTEATQANAASVAHQTPDGQDDGRSETKNENVEQGDGGDTELVEEHVPSRTKNLQSCAEMEDSQTMERGSSETQQSSNSLEESVLNPPSSSLGTHAGYEDSQEVPSSTVPKERFDALKSKFQQSRELINKLRESRQKLQRENETLRKQQEQGANGHCTGCKRHEEEKENLRRSLEEYKKQTSTYQKQLNNLNAELKERDERIEQIMEEGKALSKKQAKQESTIKELRQENRDLNADLEHSEAQLQGAKMKQENLEDELERVRQELKKLQDKDNSTTGEIQKRNEDLGETQERLQKAEGELQSLRAKYKELSEELSSKDSQYNSVLRELEELDEERNNAEDLAESYRKQLEESRSQQETLKSQMEKLHEAHTTLKKKYQKKCDETSKESTHLREQLRELEARVAEYEDIGSKDPHDEVEDTSPEHPLDRKVEEDRRLNQRKDETENDRPKANIQHWLSRLAELQRKYAAMEEDWRKREMNYQEKLREADECRLQAETSLRSTRREKENLEQESATLREEVSTLKEKNASLKEQLYESEQSHHSCQQKLKALEQEVSSEKQQTQAAQSRLNALESQLQHLENDKLEANAEVERLKKTVSEYDRKLELTENHPIQNHDDDVWNNESGKGQRISDDIISDRNCNTVGEKSTWGELLSYCRQRDGEIRALRADLEKLHSQKNQLEDQLLENAYDPSALNSANRRSSSESLREMERRYNFALELLGEKEEEAEMLEEELEHVKYQFQQQINELCTIDTN